MGIYRERSDIPENSLYIEKRIISSFNDRI